MDKYISIDKIVHTISKTHKFDKEKLYAINTSDVLEGEIINAPLMEVSELKGQFKKTIEKGDLLFSEIRPANKRYAKVKIEDTKDYVVSTKLMVLRKYNDEVDFDKDWLEDARRYYTNIVGKYGPQVLNLLKKAASLDIKIIAPLHGPVWRSNLEYFISKYQMWASYTPEEKGVLIVYASMYGNTEQAAQILASKLTANGVKKVAVYDVSKTHVSYLVSEAFKYSHIVFASVTYNLEIYPVMLDFMMHLKMLNLNKRTGAIVYNGTWAPAAGKAMREFLTTSLKNWTVLDKEVKITSALDDVSNIQIKELAKAIAEDVNQ